MMKIKWIAVGLLGLVILGQNFAYGAEGPSSTKASLLKKLSPKQMIVYHPKEVKGIVTVFTDTDCVYCRKLHHEVSELTNLGIEVRYAAYSRRGIGSSSYHKLVSIWCAKDPKEAMMRDMEGKAIPSKTCKNPIADQIMTGRKLGVSGTPTIVFEDGAIYPGYMSANQLARQAIKHSSKGE